MALSTTQNNVDTLECQSCGNKDYFVQIMKYQVNLVSGDTTRIRLLCAEVDYYRCYECDEIVHDS